MGQIAKKIKLYEIKIRTLQNKFCKGDIAVIDILNEIKKARRKTELDIIDFFKDFICVYIDDRAINAFEQSIEKLKKEE